MSGQAASYYNPNQGFDPQGQPANGYNNYNNGYTQQQGNYQPPVAEPKPPPPYPENAPPPQSGQTFNEAFKIEKPKYNDIWAGILVNGPLSSFHAPKKQIA